MNKKDIKAWLRIVEAFVAIMIVMGVVLVVLSNQGSRTDISEGVYEKQRAILNLVSKNNLQRGYVLNDNEGEINTFVSDMIPDAWEYDIEICQLDEICSSENSPNDREVYASEIIITSTLTSYNPRILKLFVWVK